MRETDLRGQAPRTPPSPLHGDALTFRQLACPARHDGIPRRRSRSPAPRSRPEPCAPAEPPAGSPSECDPTAQGEEQAVYPLVILGARRAGGPPLGCALKRGDPRIRSIASTISSRDRPSSVILPHHPGSGGFPGRMRLPACRTASACTPPGPAARELLCTIRQTPGWPGGGIDTSQPVLVRVRPLTPAPMPPPPGPLLQPQAPGAELPSPAAPEPSCPPGSALSL